MDEQGYLYYVGRKKEVISTGGINVFPQDIESVIKLHPMVDECVAFGMKDSKLGELVSVVYTSIEPQVAIQERELRAICLVELTDYQQPKHLVQLKELPKTELGKILRDQIKSDFSR